MTSVPVRVMRLYAMRAQLDATIAAEEQEAGLVEGVEPGGCPQCHAPASAAVKIVAFGEEAGKQRCTVCGHEWMPIGTGAFA
jgi:hypothetical protein